MKILTYVLHGAWDSQSADGVEVLGVSGDIKPLQKRLNEIAENKAIEFLHTYGSVEEERSDRLYEITDAVGEYAKFYITEHQLELPEETMGEISREMEKINRTWDVKQYLHDMYDGGNIRAWQYEYMTRKSEVIQEILQQFGKMEDCNTSYNTTMDNAVREVMRNIALNDEVLEFLWDEFGDVLVDDDECILDDFIGFECGTHREAVWHWFDERYSGGLSKLMFGGD